MSINNLLLQFLKFRGDGFLAQSLSLSWKKFFD